MTDLIDDTAGADDRTADLSAAVAPGSGRRPPPLRPAKVPLRAVPLLVAALVAGLMFDAAVRTPPGLAWTVCGLVVLTALWCTVAQRWAARAVLCGAALFLPWFALRSSPWLLAPNAIAFVALVLFAADIAAGGPVRRSVGGLVHVLFSSLEAAWEAPRFMGRVAVSATAPLRSRSRVPWRRVGRALAVALPVLFLLTVLLASGDQLFASTFTPSGSLGLDHLALVGVGGWLWCVVAAMATPPTRAVERPSTWSLRALDAVVLLGGVALLFGVYGAVQLNGLVQGRAYIEAKTGLTYAQYARSGFFQLMAAAAISFVVLCVVRRTVHLATSTGRVLRGLVAAVAVLTVFLVVGSIIRLRLYSDVFGLTHLRLYTVVSAVWLGVVVLFAGVAACRRSEREWVAPAATVAAAVAVLAMNIVNPDRLVAEENIGRVGTSTARFDGAYLGELSADAIPWVLANLDRVPEEDRADLLRELCGRRVEERTWWSWNSSADDAADALRQACSG